MNICLFSVNSSLNFKTQPQLLFFSSKFHFKKKYIYILHIYFCIFVDVHVHTLPTSCEFSHFMHFRGIEPVTLVLQASEF